VIAATAAVVARSVPRLAIVDASVAVKWVMAEENGDAALRLLEGGFELAAPAHWLGEAASAIWAAFRRGDLVAQEAHERAAFLAATPITPVPLERLVTDAMGIAVRLGVTIYDALYLALAEEREAMLITDDRRLLSAVHGDRQLRRRAVWIGDNALRRFSRRSP
jgi:predicted nucleic acid-binding protein